MPAGPGVDRRVPPGNCGRTSSARTLSGNPRRQVAHVGSFEVGDHQAQEGCAGQGAGQAVRQLIRQVEVAAREGGGDINSNATLRTMFSKAREASVPMDTIERAIKRGT